MSCLLPLSQMRPSKEQRLSIVLQYLRDQAHPAKPLDRIILMPELSAWQPDSPPKLRWGPSI
jgi:hypothetical protein